MSTKVLEMKHTVAINCLGRYKAVVGPNALNELASFDNFSEYAVIADSTVARLHLQKVLDILEQKHLKHCSIIFKAGEKSKNFKTLNSILEKLGKNEITRTGCIIALGGGVTGDLAGFAASIWLRGISYIQIPTTLLAMIDSSVGCKTAVDLSCGKNLAGAFWKPEAVIADTNLLQTLTKSTISEGIAEMLKIAVISSPEVFNVLSSDPAQALSPKIIAECIKLKADIVRQDPQEKDQRRLLNLGHTPGHAIEKLSEYAIKHGRAVAMGMSMIARAGLRNGITTEECCNSIIKACRKCKLPTESLYPTSLLISAMLQDKKRRGDNITLVVPVSIGHCILHTIPIDKLTEFFDAKV